MVVCKIQAILHACQPFPDIHVHMAPLALDSLSTKTLLEMKISFNVYAWYLLTGEELIITKTRCTFKQQQHFQWQPPLAPHTTQETAQIFFTVSPWLMDRGTDTTSERQCPPPQHNQLCQLSLLCCFSIHPPKLYLMRQFFFYRYLFQFCYSQGGTDTTGFWWHHQYHFSDMHYRV